MVLLSLVLAIAPTFAQAGGAEGARAPQEPRQPPPPEVREPPLVMRIEVEGERRYTREQILSALGQRAGRPLDSRAIDAGLKRLWTSFKVRADVRYREVEGGIELLVLVEELPSDREPRFVGNVEIKLKTIKKWALLENQTELFIHQAERVRQRLLEGYAKEGFYFAEVNILKRGDSEALPDVIFEIREGPKVRVKGFEIDGNEAMPDTRFLYFFKNGLSHLSKRKSNPPSLFGWFGTPFVLETLEADLLAMRAVYRDRGWLDAVVELERLDFSDDKSGVVIHVIVDEGEPYRVSTLSVQAFQWEDPDNPNDDRVAAVDLVFPEETLLGKCELEPGGLYEKLPIQRDQNALQDFYGDRGYISHASLPKRVNWEFLEPSLVFDVESHTVAVTYRIVQGRRLRVREILFAGSHHTRDRVLRRELSVFPGQYADLKEINRSLARIQATGYFKDDMNRLEHRDPVYRFIAVPDDPSMVDLQFEVDEGRVVDFNISGGIDSNDGLFGLVSLTMRNFDITDLPSSFWGTFSEIYHKEAFHGAGQLVTLEISPGTQLSRFRVRFLEPDIFRSHLKPVSLDVDLLKRLRRYDSHDEDRFTTSLRLGRKLTHDLWGAVGFVRTEVELSSLDPNGVPPGLAAQEAQGNQLIRGVTFDVTKRQLDNVFLPKAGYTARWNNALNGGFLGGDYDFVTSEAHGEYYVTAYERDDGTKPVFFFGFDGGVSLPFDDTQVTPYSERFFLGGVRSLRGFDFRGVGPMDPASGYPLGGQTYVSGTVEFQYPLHTVVQPGTYQRLESLRGTIFFDWGILDPRELTLDVDELRASVGFGIGLAWPIPIIMNFGFPVLEKSGDQTQVFSFNLGF